MVPHPDLEIRIWVEVHFFGSDEKQEFLFSNSGFITAGPTIV